MVVDEVTIDLAPSSDHGHTVLKEVGADSEHKSVAIKIANKLLSDDHFVPIVQETKLLLLNFLDRESETVNFALSFYDDVEIKDLELPWNEIDLYNPMISEISKSNGDPSRELTEYYKQHKLYNPEYTAEASLFELAFSRMSEDHKDEIRLFMADFLPKCDRYMTKQGEIIFFDILFNNINIYSDISLSVGNKLTGFFSEKSKATYDSYEVWFGLDEMIKGERFKLLLRPIITYPDRVESIDSFNRIVGRIGMPRIIDGVRSIMKNERDKEDTQNFLLYIMGNLQNDSSKYGSGVNKPSVEESVSGFYNKFNIDDYRLTDEAKHFRVGVIENILQRHGIHRDISRVLELACGTGWLTNDLNNQGISTWGIDITEGYINQAIGQFAKYSDKYSAVDWQDLSKLPNSFPDKYNAVVSMGRSFPRHTETFAGMKIVATQAYNRLSENGIFIFDTPDPQKGVQAEKLNNYRDYLKKFGYSSEWLNKYFWMMVGAPPGQKGDVEYYINTLVPDQEIISILMGIVGFKIEEVICEDNYDHKGSDNLIYVCRKMTAREFIGNRKEFANKLSELIKNQPENQNHYREIF